MRVISHLYTLKHFLVAENGDAPHGHDLVLQGIRRIGLLYTCCFWLFPLRPAKFPSQVVRPPKSVPSPSSSGQQRFAPSGIVPVLRRARSRHRAHESLIAEVMPLAASCTLAIPAAAGGWISRGAGQRRRVLAGWLPLPKLAAHLLCPLVCIVSERAVCTVSACCPETILHILQVCQSCL